MTEAGPEAVCGGRRNPPALPTQPPPGGRTHPSQAHSGETPLSLQAGHRILKGAAHVPGRTIKCGGVWEWIKVKVVNQYHVFH